MKYRPSNGTEGMGFMDCFCDHCIHERWMHRQEADREEDKCDILSRTMIYVIDEPEYPSEWTYDENGRPTCTNYVNFDWGDEDNPNEPPDKPTPPDPDQLDMFPLYPDETTFEKTAVKICLIQ